MIIWYACDFLGIQEISIQIKTEKKIKTRKKQKKNLIQDSIYFSKDKSFFKQWASMHHWCHPTSLNCKENKNLMPEWDNHWYSHGLVKGLLHSNDRVLGFQHVQRIFPLQSVSRLTNVISDKNTQSRSTALPLIGGSDHLVQSRFPFWLPLMAPNTK